MKKLALVLWENSNQGWKGTIQAGDVPHKIVFIDGANRGSPKGVTPEENRLILVEITGETKPGERKGVLFAKPLRPAMFGWVPVGEPISGFHRHEWRCVEEGFEFFSSFGGIPTEEPEENRKYLVVKESIDVFHGQDYWKVFALFGLPDRAESAEYNTIRFFWDGIGDRRMDPNRLLYGAVGMSEQKFPGEKKRSWEEATRPWEAEYIAGTLSHVPGGWTPKYNLKIVGAFRFCRFPEAIFSLEVLSTQGSWVSRPDKIWQLIPEPDRESITDDIVRAIPSPKKVAEEVFSGSETTGRLFEAEEDRASFEVPGKIQMETVSSREWVSYPESDDGYRSAGSYETWVTRRVISWGLPGEERRSLCFSQGVSETEMFQGTQETLALACVNARKAIRDLARSNPYHGCLKFVSDFDRKKWEVAYGQACGRLIARILREAREVCETEVSRRWGIVKAWESADVTYETAVRALEEARNVFRQVRADLYEWDEIPKEPPHRSHWQSPEDKESYSAKLAEWAGAITADIRARATERGFMLVNGKLEKLPETNPDKLKKINEIRRQAGIKSPSPPPPERKEGGAKPASSDSLERLISRFKK